MSLDLPFFLKEFEAVPGSIKGSFEDFRVEEIPSYLPCGSGDHIYVVIEKRGLSTARAVRDIARKLGRNPRDVGVAGMKDARGVTVQTLSIEHVDPDRVAGLDIPRIRVLSVSRHKNKLRMGHLKGNRFKIVLRDTDLSKIEDTKRMLGKLEAKGVPNYFAEQRFGMRGDTWRIGEALLKDDFEEAAHLVAGRPGPEDSKKTLRARELFEAGDYSQAAGAWPRGFDESFSLCRAMDRFQDFKRAIFSLNKRALGFYVSACQSRLFNCVLAERIDKLDELEVGDLAWKHDSGAVFPVERLEDEKPRAGRFEISATGPMFGPKMKSPTGEPLIREKRALESLGMTDESFSKSGALKSPGARRPIRFKPEDANVSLFEDENGSGMELCFTLPSGCYATAVLREICKERLIHLDGPRGI